jgi:hypothetical protein
MNSSIILPSAFDISKLSLGNVKTLDNGGKMVYVSYDNKPFIIQTPEMISQFGLSRWNSDNGAASDKYTMELSFKDKDSRSSLGNFFNMLGEIDKQLVKEGMENSQAWFKKKYSTTEVVEALYTPQVKHPKDKETGEISDKYPPTFRLSLPTRDGKFTCDVYDEKRNKINLNDIELKKAKITGILQCSGIWLAGGKFGMSWRVLQLRVVPPATIKGFAFQDLDEEKLVDSDIDEDEPNNVAMSKNEILSDSDEDCEIDDVPAPTPSTKAVVPKVVLESEGDEDDDEEDEIEKPKAKKSIVMRKKPAAK